MSLTESSVVARQLRQLQAALRSAVDESRVLTIGSRVRAAGGQAVGATLASSRAVAGLDRATDTSGRWIRGSWLYGWLTAEPEPEIVVIDLRETYTVGPIIAVLDRAVAWAAPRWRRSAPQRAVARGGRALANAPVRVAGFLVIGAILAMLAVTIAGGDSPDGGLLVLLGLALLATRERRSAAELGETWLGRAVAALLVPPEPPSDRDSGGEREAPEERAATANRDVAEEPAPTADRDGPESRDQSDPERDD